MASAKSGKIYVEQSRKLAKLRLYQEQLITAQSELGDNPNSARLKGDVLYLEMTIARYSRELTKWIVARYLLGGTIYVNEYEALLDGPPVTFL